jgi:hypothetical protein
MPARSQTAPKPAKIFSRLLVEEAAKCQLRCKPCHVAKGAEDRPELAHGTYYVYWY